MLDEIDFPEMSFDEVEVMTQPFRIGEIKGVMTTSNGIKSPGPDEFNFSFFKRFWDLIQGEVVTHVQPILRNFNSSTELFIVLYHNYSKGGCSPLNWGFPSYFPSWISL
jgi:hypothetical protein